MENQDYSNLVYGERIKWIDQQLKSGKTLDELLDTQVRTYQQRVPNNPENKKYYEMVYGERIKWIHQQLKGGKTLNELLDTRVRTYQMSVPHMTDIELPTSEAGTLTCDVNLAVMKEWEHFTSAKQQDAETLISMALWDYMSKTA